MFFAKCSTQGSERIILQSINNINLTICETERNTYIKLTDICTEQNPIQDQQLFEPERPISDWYLLLLSSAKDLTAV